MTLTPHIFKNKGQHASTIQAQIMPGLLMESAKEPTGQDTLDKATVHLIQKHETGMERP